MKIFVLAVFILTYVAIIAFPKFKVLSVGVSAVLTVGTVAIFGGESVLAALSSVDYNVILMLVGIMLTVGVFSESGMPNRLADGLMSKISSSLPAIIVLVVLSGLVSAFIDNVATVLMLAPIGLAVAKKAEVSPVPVIIGIAVSSNLQGAATLVGDTTSIMLGGFADMLTERNVVVRHYRHLLDRLRYFGDADKNLCIADLYEASVQIARETYRCYRSILYLCRLL